MLGQSPNKHLENAKKELLMASKASTGYPAKKPEAGVAAAFAELAANRHSPKKPSAFSPRLLSDSPESASPKA